MSGATKLSKAWILTNSLHGNYSNILNWKTNTTVNKSASSSSYFIHKKSYVIVPSLFRVFMRGECHSLQHMGSESLLQMKPTPPAMKALNLNHWTAKELPFLKDANHLPPVQMNLTWLQQAGPVTRQKTGIQKGRWHSHSVWSASSQLQWAGVLTLKTNQRNHWTKPMPVEERGL